MTFASVGSWLKEAAVFPFRAAFGINDAHAQTSGVMGPYHSVAVYTLAGRFIDLWPTMCHSGYWAFVAKNMYMVYANGKWFAVNNFEKFDFTFESYDGQNPAEIAAGMAGTLGLPNSWSELVWRCGQGQPLHSCNLAAYNGIVSNVSGCVPG